MSLTPADTPRRQGGAPGAARLGHHEGDDKPSVRAHPCRRRLIWPDAPCPSTNKLWRSPDQAVCRPRATRPLGGANLEHRRHARRRVVCGQRDQKPSVASNLRNSSNTRERQPKACTVCERRELSDCALLMRHANSAANTPPAFQSCSYNEPMTTTELQSHARPDVERLLELRLFRGLSTEALSSIAANIEYVRLKRGSSSIIREAYPRRALIVWEGDLVGSVFGPVGQGVELLPLGRGDTFGFAGAVTTSLFGPGVRLSTQGGGALLLMRFEDVAALSDKDHTFSQNLTRELGALVIDYASRVFELGALDVQTRLALKLLRLAQHTGSSSGTCIIKNPPTHAALARAIGASREAVTRHLHELAETGLLTFSRDRIELLNTQTLRAVVRSSNAQLVVPDTDMND